MWQSSNSVQMVLVWVFISKLKTRIQPENTVSICPLNENFKFKKKRFKKQADKNIPGNQTCKQFFEILWVHKFFFQLNFLPPYSLCLQGDNMRSHNFSHYPEFNFIRVKWESSSKNDVTQTWLFSYPSHICTFYAS